MDDQRIGYWERCSYRVPRQPCLSNAVASTFVLISQNRMAAVAERRSELDLQISLLAEHEITRLTTPVASIAERLEVRTEVEDELDEIQEDVSPEAVLDALETSGEERGQTSTIAEPRRQ